MTDIKEHIPDALKIISSRKKAEVLSRNIIEFFKLKKSDKEFEKFKKIFNNASDEEKILFSDTFSTLLLKKKL